MVKGGGGGDPKKRDHLFSLCFTTHINEMCHTDVRARERVDD